MAGQAMSHDYHITALGGLPCIARVHNYIPVIPATWNGIDGFVLDEIGSRAGRGSICRPATCAYC